MIEQQTGVYNNPYKFNAKELDKETGLYYYGARYYNPRLSVLYGVDPLAVYNPVMETQFYGDGQHNDGVFFWGNLNPYIYTYQNPIRYIDPNGKQTLGEQFGIAVKNPFRIGLMHNAGHNLANIAGEFSRRGARSSSPSAVLERNGPVASDADRGGERGAFRHATWMALIASEYNSNKAEWVGNLHEGKATNTSNTNNILGIMGADTIADELNNEIGRNYGSKHKGAQANDIASGVLKVFNEEGLYQVENGNGANRFNVVRKKLSDEKYNLLKNRFEGLSNDGVSPRPTKTETEKAKRNYIKNGTP